MTAAGPSTSAGAEGRVGRQVPWSLATQAASRGITLLTTLILARLLAPADFGLVALATLALTALNVLSDLGLTGVLVVRQDLDRRGQGTLLTLLLAAGAACAALLLLLAPAIAALFREPRVTDVLRALAALALISGLSWFYDMLLQRELEFRRRFLAQLARNGVYALVAIAAAAAGAGVWSLVAGQLAGSVALGAALLALAPYRVRPAFDREAATSSLREGRGFLLQAAVSTVQDNVDFVVVGRALGAAPLGAYTMAYRLGELPYAGIAEPVARVTFPAFARMRHQGADVAPPFLRALRSVALLTVPLGMLLSAAADPFTRAVLGERWLAMIGPLTVLGLWAALRPLETVLGWFLNAMGQAGRSGRISALLLAPFIPALIAGAAVGGATGVAWAVLAHLVVTVILQAGVAHRRLGVSAARVGAALAPLALPAAGCWAAARAVAAAGSALPPAASLGLSVAAGAAAYLVLVRVLDRDLLGSTVRDARRSLRRGP